MIVDNRRSVGFRSEAESSDGEPAAPGPVELNSTLQRTLVGSAVAQLSAEHRAVLCRSYHRGWTTAQIAADLGITEATAKSALHYALRNLRQTLLYAGDTMSGALQQSRLRIDSIRHTRKD